MSVVRDKLLLGIEPSPDVAAILVVYFVQGAIGASFGWGGWLLDEVGKRLKGCIQNGWNCTPIIPTM